jgi:hypothetical protein
MPNPRLWCSGMRLRGVVGGLRRIGLLRSCVGLAIASCVMLRCEFTFRVVAQASFRFWKPYCVIEGLWWGDALVLLESFWIVFGSDDAALRAAAEPHISLILNLNFFRTLSTDLCLQYSLLVLLLNICAAICWRAASIPNLSAKQKEKLLSVYSTALKFRRTANFKTSGTQTMPKR